MTDETYVTKAQILAAVTANSEALARLEGKAIEHDADHESIHKAIGALAGATGERFDALDKSVAEILRILRGEDGELPPPPPRLPLLGINTWTAPEVGAREAAIGSALGAAFTFGAHRIFVGPGKPFDLQQSPRYIEDRERGRLSIVSVKDHPSQAQVDQMLESVDHPTSLTVHHEFLPEMTGADWNAMALPVLKRIKESGVPDVQTRLTLQGWDFDPWSGPRAVTSGALDPATLAYVDVLAVDPYNPWGYDPDGDGKGSDRWLHLDQMLEWVLDVAGPYGFDQPWRLAVDETACPEDGGDKAEWLRRSWETAKSLSLAWWCYYDVQYGEIAHTPGHMLDSSPAAWDEFCAIASETVGAGRVR